MKLKTEIRYAEDDDFRLYPYVDGEQKTIAHDATAAHVLMQAISEQLGSDERGPLLDRADELMREWGFE